MDRIPRVFAGIVMIALLAGLTALLIRRGSYGLTMFVVFPVLLGAIAAWVVGSASAGHAAKTGMLANLIASAALLLIGSEGAICILMTLPLALPLGALGGCLAFWMNPSRMRSGSAAILLLVPAGTLGWDTTVQPEVFEVRSAIEIAASAEEVWRHVVSFSDLPEPQEWYFRAGLAYPMRARIEGAGVGAVRYCEFSTGPFVEPIEVWDAPDLLQFRVTANPAPMHEWSPYGQIMPRHLEGYMVSKRGQFKLTRLSGKRTLLEGTTWYQHGLWPALYWRWWSDAIIHRIHTRVLTHIQSLAEAH